MGGAKIHQRVLGNNVAAGVVPLNVDYTRFPCVEFIAVNFNDGRDWIELPPLPRAISVFRQIQCALIHYALTPPTQLGSPLRQL